MCIPNWHSLVSLVILLATPFLVVSFLGLAWLPVTCSVKKRNRAWGLISREWCQNRKDGSMCVGTAGRRTARGVNVPSNLTYISSEWWLYAQNIDCVVEQCKKTYLYVLEFWLCHACARKGATPPSVSPYWKQLRLGKGLGKKLRFSLSDRQLPALMYNWLRVDFGCLGSVCKF